jgi:hypothetical protein
LASANKQKRSRPTRRAKPFAEDVTGALCLAAPFAIAARFDDYNHCVVASAAGSAVLKRFGLNSELVFCGLILEHTTRETIGSIGVRPQWVYDRIAWGDAQPEPFEEWLKRAGGDYTPDSIHAVIRVKAPPRFLLIDLTIGQIRKRLPAALREGLRTSMTIRGTNKWPTAQFGEWFVRYMPSEKDTGYLDETIRVYSRLDSGLAGDLYDLTRLALEVRNDIDLFIGALRDSAPELYAKCKAKLTEALALEELQF